MKMQAALVTVVVFVAGVLVQLSRPVPEGSRVSAAAPRGLAIDGSLGRGSAEAVLAASKQRIAASYGKLPLSFEANRGQTDSPVKFVSRGRGYSLFLTATETLPALSRGHDSERAPRARVAELQKGTAVPSVLRMKLAGANSTAQVEGIDKLPGNSNYFIGNDPMKWRANVPQYAKVRYRNVYPGVDLVYYGNKQQVEHDFIVAPGANPSQIRFAVNGSDRMELSSTGDLVMHVADAEVRLQKPTIYQQEGGARKEVAGSYKVKGKQVSFQVAAYDASQPLVIDPVLVYSTYLGGTDFEAAQGIAVDSEGSAYVTGWARSRDFPTTSGSFQPAHAGGPECVVPPSTRVTPCNDVFVAKLNPEGNTLVYATYLGGSGEDRSYGIAVDSAGNAYIVGRTKSADFPTQNALQPASLKDTYGPGLWDGFVTKLNSQGDALVYSTYLGGSGFDFPLGGVAVDSEGSAYVTGFTNSPDFPTKNPLHGFNGAICDSFPFEAGDIQPPAPCLDAFVSKINPEGSALVYSTYLGGSGHDEASSIAVDARGNAYVAGLTASENFPTTDDAFQQTYGGALMMPLWSS